MLHRPTRRQFLSHAAGLTTAALLPTPLGAQPTLQTVRQQFTLVRGARPVPAVLVKRIDGKAIVLTALRGKVVLVNFWATWCPACRNELPTLDRLAQTSREENLHVIAVSADREGASQVTSFIKKLNIRHLDIGFETAGLIARKDDAAPMDTPFQLYAMPISYLVGVTGQVEGYITGEVDWTSHDAVQLIRHYSGVR
jgi:thiol-disulfide isomerase/thioredoxin